MCVQTKARSRNPSVAALSPVNRPDSAFDAGVQAAGDSFTPMAMRTAFRSQSDSMIAMIHSRM